MNDCEVGCAQGVICDWQGRTAVADCQINNQSINHAICTVFIKIIILNE